VRQAEAKAKGEAREQAARDLSNRLASEARTARLVDAARQKREASSGDSSDNASAPDAPTPDTEATAVLPVNLEPTEVLRTRAADGDADYGDDDYDDEDEDDDVPRSRWRLGNLGKRKS
jgi:hypothetical protein